MTLGRPEPRSGGEANAVTEAEARGLAEAFIACEIQPRTADGIVITSITAMPTGWVVIY